MIFSDSYPDRSDPYNWPKNLIFADIKRVYERPPWTVSAVMNLKLNIFAGLGSNQVAKKRSIRKKYAFLFSPHKAYFGGRSLFYYII